MFVDAHFASSQGGGRNKRDEDGAKRVFFGGERFIEGISGEAHVMPIGDSVFFYESYFSIEPSLWI